MSNLAVQEMVEERDIHLPVVPVEPQPGDLVFAPEAHFDQWLQSVAEFRARQWQKDSADIVLDGQELDFHDEGYFDARLERIKGPGTLVLAEHGDLQADIVVGTALIDGVLRGNITASESVVVKNHAVVIGDINTPRLTIRGGAIIEGECYFEGSREPETPAPVWAVLKGGLAKVWRGRLFQ